MAQHCQDPGPGPVNGCNVSSRRWRASKWLATMVLVLVLRLEVCLPHVCRAMWWVVADASR